MRASGSTILWHVTIAAVIVISRNEILTALEDENDSSRQPRDTVAYAQAAITLHTIFLPLCNTFLLLSLSFLCIRPQSFFASFVLTFRETAFSLVERFEKSSCKF